MISEREPSPSIKSKELATSDARFSPRRSPIRNVKSKLTLHDFIIFANLNFMKLVTELFIIIILMIFVRFYLNLRKEKKDEIDSIQNSTSPKQLECQEKYEINNCDKISQNDKNPPLLLKICDEYEKCRHEKHELPNLSELTVAYIGELTDVFVSELNMHSLIAIFTFLTIFILIESLRNRPKVVI